MQHSLQPSVSNSFRVLVFLWFSANNVYSDIISFTLQSTYALHVVSPPPVFREKWSEFTTIIVLILVSVIIVSNCTYNDEH